MRSGASLLSRVSSFCIHTCHKRWKTVADRGAHLFEHDHRRLLGLAENLPRSSCVSSRFQSECTYLFWGISAPFQPLIVVFSPMRQSSTHPLTSLNAALEGFTLLKHGPEQQN